MPYRRHPHKGGIMAEILPMVRRARTPGGTSGGGFFTPDDSKNKNFMEEDLARSGLVWEDLEAYTHPMTRVRDGSEASYNIPYNDIKGRPIVDTDGTYAMYR